MKNLSVVFTALALSAAQLFAQKCVNPHFDAQRLDFRDLGYPGATEIPADSSPITALLAHSNGRVYGATTGKASHLFAWDARVNKVFPLGILASAKGVHHALVEGPDGIIYIGTGLGEIGTLRLTRDMPEGRRAIETQLWKDIQSHYAAYEGGHLYAYDPVKGDDAVYLEGTPARVVDLGIPVPSNSVYACVENVHAPREMDGEALLPRSRAHLARRTARASLHAERNGVEFRRRRTPPRVHPRARRVLGNAHAHPRRILGDPSVQRLPRGGAALRER